MARGAARAPSQNAYRGPLGRTRTETVQVTGPRGELIAATVHATIDAVSDPELADRLHAGTLNQLRLDGVAEPIALAVPVVYHDPAAELLVLVLGEAHRHRELDERIRLYQQLRDDGGAIPPYVKEFAVVFGPAGLRAYIESRAHEAAASAVTAKESERRRSEIAQRDGELDRQRKELAELRAELAARTAELSRAREVAAEATTIGPPPDAPAHKPVHEDLNTKPVERQPDELHDDAPPAARPHKPLPSVPRLVPPDFDHEPTTAAAPPGPPAAAPPEPLPPPPEPADEESTGTAIIPPGSDPLTTETHELPLDSDPWLEFAATGATSSLHVDNGQVRLALLAGDQIARGLGGALDVRVLLHRVNTGPVITLVIGPPAALRVPSPTQLAVIALDVAFDLDRAILVALSKQFDLLVDIVVRGRPIRRVRLVAPLADNVGYVLRAAEDHLSGITADGEVEPSFQRARDLVLGAGYDLLGIEHAEHGEFRDDKLAQLESAQAVRRAIAIARRFARPSREDYLIASRGFPLERWRELRRHVLESAVAWGIWMGPELAQVAVSEGLARSRRDLVLRLETGFEALRHHPTAFDIDEDAAADNLKALAEEARALGVELRHKPPTNGTIKSEDGAVVSGSIERTPTQGILRGKSTDELIAMLDDRKDRVTAAAELSDRADARAAGPVIAAVKKMSRAEAVRILGKSIKFGEAAAAPLIEGLASSKAFLRHGCALALALLHTDDGT
ncbi:MAG TPA: hypothetical protein VLX92_11850, partial [Kofleriaceae bacterium]|nr:hypothetical protein [Kofleriaceae bacterium]